MPVGNVQVVDGNHQEPELIEDPMMPTFDEENIHVTGGRRFE